MKLSDWARQNGVHPKTALRWFDRGLLPVPARKVGPRTILVQAPSEAVDAVALYARVSSHDQREDLERQMGRLVEWSAARGLRVSHTVSEVGSGMYAPGPSCGACCPMPRFAVSRLSIEIAWPGWDRSTSRRRFWAVVGGCW